MRIETEEGFSIPLYIKAVKLFHQDHVGVLFHVRGDLYLIVSHFQKTSTVSAFLVNKREVTMDGVISPPELVISRSMGLRQVVDALGAAVVASFYYKGAWKVLTLPK